MVELQSLLAPITAIVSVLLRAFVYLFLRWIPGHHFPPIVYTLFAVYAPTAFLAYRGSPVSLTVSDEIDVSVTDSVELSDPLSSPVGVGANASVKEAVEIKETISVYEDGPSPLIILLTGLPSVSSPILSLISATLNLVLVLVVIQVVYEAPLLHPSHEVSFSRVGFVADTTAKILIREPNSAKYPISLSYRQANSLDDLVSPSIGQWKTGGRLSDVSVSTDFVQSLSLTKLRPETHYQYAFSNNRTGVFRTAPATGSYPRGDTETFTFLTSSCIKRRFPYSPLDHPLAIPGLRYLEMLIPSLKAQFMLFLGDFIYVDVPLRLGSDVATYRQEYHQVYNSPSWSPVSKSLPWIHVIDDHDIANDWDANTTGVYAAAMDPWHIYHASVNPSSHRPSVSYYSFDQGPASFFLLDTRQYRTEEYAAPPTDPSKSMLGAVQLADLLLWLRKPPPHGVQWKIVVSSVPFTKNWKVNAMDTWSGYLYERRLILEAMWDASSHGVGVVVLSGDRHEFAATAFPPPKGGRWPDVATVHEFSTSPLSMFYLPVRTYWQSKGDVEDVAIKYIPDGNSKFASVEIDRVRKGQKGNLTFKLFVDGKEKWNHLLTAP